MLDFPNDKEVLSYCSSLPWLFNQKLLDTTRVQYSLNEYNTVDIYIVNDDISFLYSLGLKLLSRDRNNPLIGKVDIYINTELLAKGIEMAECCFILYNIKDFQEYVAMMGFVAMNKQYFDLI